MDCDLRCDDVLSGTHLLGLLEPQEEDAAGGVRVDEEGGLLGCWLVVGGGVVLSVYMCGGWRAMGYHTTPNTQSNKQHTIHASWKAIPSSAGGSVVT